MLFVLIVFLGSFFILTGSAFAASIASITPKIPLSGYCNNPNPHCYAEITWNGHTGGANTLINPFGAMDCQGCNGFITNETWFSDNSSKQCTKDSLGACWVEAGISTWPANDPKSCHQRYDST